MLTVDARLRNDFPGQLLLLQVHDELLLEVDEDRAGEVGEMVKSEMCSAMELTVPLVVDLGTGKNWQEAH
jgi:DNA polymerase-1